MNSLARPASLAITVVCLVLALAFSLSCLGLSVFVVPGYEKTFLDFRMRIPWHAELTIDISRWLVNYWYVVVIMLLPLFAGVGFVVYFLRHHTNARVVSWILCFGIILIPLAAQLLM